MTTQSIFWFTANLEKHKNRVSDPFSVAFSFPLIKIIYLLKPKNIIKFFFLMQFSCYYFKGKLFFPKMLAFCKSKYWHQQDLGGPSTIKYILQDYICVSHTYQIIASRREVILQHTKLTSIPKKSIQIRFTNDAEKTVCKSCGRQNVLLLPLLTRNLEFIKLILKPIKLGVE